MFKIPNNKTKIIATIGPASGDKKVLSKMIDAGMDIVRFNFSHGDYETFEKWLNDIRVLAIKKNQPVEVMQDLQGPRIRLGGDVPKKGVTLKTGNIYSVGFGKYRKGFIPIDYKNIIKDVRRGTKILLVDGLVILEVIKKEKKFLRAKVLQGGRIFPRKSVNIPGEKLSVSSLTEKDLQDLDWGIKNKVDYIALSFVRGEDDLKSLKKIIYKKDKHSKIKIIPKIEKPQAVKNLKSILRTADMVMVARGDLGVETGLAKIPEIQKDIILKCKKAGKPVIVATEMMESMTNNSEPTRAEVSDVANAVFDGADAVMLSGETTVGKYPVQVVQMVEKILRESEKKRFMMRFSLKRILNNK